MSQVAEDPAIGLCLDALQPKVREAEKLALLVLANTPGFTLDDDSREGEE